MNPSLLLGGAQFAGGLLQGIFSGKKKRERELEDYISNSPKYTPNQSILDFYQKALQRYNTNPTDSAAYKLDAQNAMRGTMQGLSALRDRRSSLAGVPALIDNQNRALLRASVAGENRRAQDFGMLGNATRMRAGEEAKAFQQNKVVPFEAMYNLKAMKAGGANAQKAAGWRNMFGGLGTAATGYDWEKKKSNSPDAYTGVEI